MTIKISLPLLVISIFLFTTLEANFSKKYYGFHLCDRPGFMCQKVQSHHTWAELFPDPEHREIIKRLNRTNIKVINRPYIVVPTQLTWLNYMSLSPLPQHIDGHNEKLVVVDLSQQAFAAYDARGKQIKWGPISGGKSWCNDVSRPCRTVVGSFRVTREGGPGCKSRKYDDAPMPYCMFFHGGFAMHGSWLPGHHASHGCVRMFTSDAEWLNKNFVSKGTKVIVKKGFPE